MSSKINVKQSKKERPRSSDKLKKVGKRDGTPEKPTTPSASQEGLLEEGLLQQDRKIINDEILALQIRPDQLERLREPRPPSERKQTPPKCSVVVRKLKPASEWDKPRPKIITVAKPAPPDAPLKPVDYEGAAGPRFDSAGKIIPHSILGSVEDFKREALKSGELPADLLKASEDGGDQLPVKLQEKTSQYPKFQSVEESNALKNWHLRMMERRKQQNHLSKLLNKDPDRLVMNQSDTYRKTQELRYLIDRTIPTMDYGKGYRVGSEFWQQQERIGDDLTGIQKIESEIQSMTLRQTEKGYPPPVEHVGVPCTVLGEKGTDFGTPRTPFHKPWHKTPYLRDRLQQLQPVMDELDPYQPDVLNLEVVGSNQPPKQSRRNKGGSDISDEEDMEETAGFKEEFLEQYQGDSKENIDPLKSYPDVHPQPIFGPSIQFAGQPARWTGDSVSFKGQVGVEARVTFESYAGDRTTSHLQIMNDGTTCIYFDWKRVPKNNPLEIMNAKVQRFYFNTSSGCILPGDTISFPFIFKSPNAGVFTEQWQLETRPVVCGGAALVVTLRGVAQQKDKFKQQRTELEQELAKRQTEQIVKGLLDDVLEGLRTPERARSPVDAYITEEEIFSRKNPRLYYNSETVQQLREQWMSLFPKEESPEPRPDGGEEGEEEEEEEAEPWEPTEPPEWDLSIETMEEYMMGLDEDEEQKQELLQQLNRNVFSLSFPPFTPTQQQMYNTGYQLMVETVDSLVGEAAMLRVALGMPEQDGDSMPDDLKSPSQSRRDSRLSIPRPASNTHQGADGKGNEPAFRKDGSKGTTPGINRSATRADMKTASSRDGKKGQRGKVDSKDKRGAGKDAKGGAAGAAGKGTGKDVARAGKMASGGKRPVTRDKEHASSPTTPQSPPPSGGDPVLQAKYKQKLYTQAYVLVNSMVDQMAQVFDEVQQEEGGPKLPTLV